MNKKELNYLLMNLGIFKNKQLDKNLNIDDDTHFTDAYNKTNEIITNELNENQVKIALLAKQTEYLKTIKNILLFFFAVFVCSGIAALYLILK